TRDYLSYYKHYQSKCPVAPESRYGMMIVTGHQEATEIYRQGDRFWTCQVIGGPLHPLPFKPEGDDIRPQVRDHRHEMAWGAHFVTMEDEPHTAYKAVIARVMTHERLKQNTDYMVKLADRLIDKFIDRGSCEYVSEFSQEIATMVIADLLG